MFSIVEQEKSFLYPWGKISNKSLRENQENLNVKLSCFIGLVFLFVGITTVFLINEY